MGSSVGPRITIIGGGSNQWTPTLVTDIANTPSLHAAEIFLQDINPEPLPRMASYVEHVARQRGIPLTVGHTTDQRQALEGADFVVIAISTGGFTSMRHDVDVPARYGIIQSVGDAGPAGVSRSLRNVPVLVSMARNMEEICPDAWLLNVTNPMAQLCRAVTRETSVKTVGLCHEVTITRFYLSMLLDTDFRHLEPTVVGVNHLPLITRLGANGDDGLARLRELLDGPADGRTQRLAQGLPEGLGHEPKPAGDAWTKADLLAMHQVKLELFRRFGVLPAAGDRHLAEYFPGFLTPESGWGQRWGVHVTTVEEREAHERGYAADLDRRLASDEVSPLPSGEMVAPVIDSLITGRRRVLPLNLPNTGQAVGLPSDAVVETMCLVDGDGIRGGEPAGTPGVLGEHLRRVSTTHELTVEAALTGDRQAVVAAMLADPLASRLDYDELVRMTAELIDVTKPWLPQFQ